MSSSVADAASGFDRFALGSSIRRGIDAAGFTEPRPIQTETLPAALEGRDVLGLAQTGTGKTAAFALPILERILTERAPGPRALVVAPTRELATQIGDEIDRLARFTQIRSAVLFGGVSVRRQELELRKNPQIIVACPGRLLDLHGQGLVRLDRIEILVLDEADHMFDMGFLPDVRRILAALPERRQNLLFSATMPTEIRRLAKEVLQRPHVSELSHSRPVSTIDHALYPIDPADKMQLLQEVLSGEDFVSAIVFTRTKHRARRLAQQLERSGHRAIALQGNMSQNARVRAMTGFRNGDYDVLVATDIAARGLDIQQVSHVVNFDMPQTPDAYTHRIGRTGRSEREGQAFTFVSGEDLDLIQAVEARIGASIPRRSFRGIPMIALDESSPARRGSGGRQRSGGRGRPGTAAAGGRTNGRGRGTGGGRPGRGGSGRKSGGSAAAAGTGSGTGTGSRSDAATGATSGDGATPRRRPRRRRRRSSSGGSAS